MNKKLDDMKDWFESEEGKKSLDRFAERMNREHGHQMRWIERFKKWAEPDIDAAIENRLTKNQTG
jgi:hypothetical protein